MFRSHAAVCHAIVLGQRFPRALQWHVRPGHRLVVISAGRNTWMMMVSVVDSWAGVMLPWWLLWRQRRGLLLRWHRARLGNVRRWNARQVGQMRWRNLMRRRRWRWRRMAHMGMRLRLLLLGLGWMSVHHPSKPSSRRRSAIRDHCCGFYRSLYAFRYFHCALTYANHFQPSTSAQLQQ